MEASSRRAHALVLEGTFNAQDLTNTAWALATFRIEDLPLLEAIASSAVAQQDSFHGQDLANTAWAYAKLQVLHAPVFDAIAAQALARISEAEPQNLANTAWAFATMKLLHTPLISAMAGQAASIVRQFGPQECANMVWSLANLMFVDAPCLAAIANKFLTSLKTGSVQNLTNTVWAYAQMRLKNTTLFGAIAQESIVLLPQFRERDLSITAWAFARQELRDEQFLRAVAAEAVKGTRSFVGCHQEIANLSWAMALLDLYHGTLLDSLATAASKTNASDFTSQEIASIVWSFASLKYRDQPLMDTLTKPILDRLPEAISQNIVNIAWALDCLTWEDREGGGFLRILQRFLQISASSLGVEWVTLATIAKERGFAERVPEFMDRFDALVLGPARRMLQQLRRAATEAERSDSLTNLQRWVEELQVPHLGSAFLGDALRAAGAVPSEGFWPWLAEARSSVQSAAWWSCPHAAVSSQGVVAWLAAEVQVSPGRLVREPGTVYVADDSTGLILVERMIQPLFLQVPRHGHAERKAMVALLRSALREQGSHADAATTSSLQEATGWVRLYASHYLCISCLAALAQFTRTLPQVTVEVGCDNAWSSFSARPRSDSHVLAIGLRL